MITKEHEASGFTPLGRRVTIKIPKLEEKTSGGIILPDELRSKEEMAQLDAELIAIGEFAFADLVVQPKVGDTVKISKYAGLIYKGSDEEEYRIAFDDDIVAFGQIIDVEKEIEEWNSKKK